MRVARKEYCYIQLTKKEADLLRLALQKLPHSTIMQEYYGFDENEINLIDDLHSELVKSKMNNNY